MIKAFFILVNILTRKAKSLQFCHNFDFDKTFSGDDSVTLPDSTQPEEPVSKTPKRKKNLKKCKILVLKGSSYKEKVCTRSTCDGGMFTYEKTTGHFLRTAR